MTNTGATTIDRVQLILESIDPVPTPNIPVPVLLHVMNDNPEVGPFQTQFTLDPDQTCYVDVVLKIEIPWGPNIEVCHIVPGVNKTMVAREYELVILAHGQDVVPRRKRFIVDIDINADPLPRMFFRPA